MGEHHDQTFHVDLRGLVDLLSHHLYSSPRVYLREVVQNAVDAITARTLDDPGAPRRVDIVPADVAADGCLHVRDTGIGLDADGIRSVLATIGASSKRDELGFARESFLGQFGIGLLSCFLVSDEIRLLTRRVGTDRTWEWTGRADGTYAVAPAPAERHLAEPGTEVVLRPRSGEVLLGAEAVGHLAELYAAYLPVEVHVDLGAGPQRAGGRSFPWQDQTLAPADRRVAARQLCLDLLGFEPLDQVELVDPVSGVRGYAFVTPVPAGRRAHHRLYAKQMLVGEAVEGVLPDWALFVRAVLDGERLQLTASREAVQEDESLAETRERLGAGLRRWLLRTAGTDPDRMRRFLQVHHLGAKAMAAEDDEMLDLVAGLLTWETTRGELTLDDFGALDRVLTYTDSVQDFRQVAPIAQVLGLAVLNAGYAYDGEIVRRWLARHDGADSRRLLPSEVSARFEALDPQQAAAFAPLLEVADEVLARGGVRPQVRSFEPAGLHAVLLVDRVGRQDRDRAEVAQGLDGPWAQLLGDGPGPAAPAATFVLNAANQGVRRIADLRDRDLQRVVVEALYAQALVSGHHPMRAFESALVARALPALIDRAIDHATGRSPS